MAKVLCPVCECEDKNTVQQLAFSADCPVCLGLGFVPAEVVLSLEYASYADFMASNPLPANADCPF
jgi:hypothetical protein